MKLHKILLMVAGSVLAACSSTDDAPITPNDKWLENAPGTEVYVGVDALNNLKKANISTRATVNQLAPIADIYSFGVKVDPRLGYNVAQKIYTEVVTGGKLYTDCPFITINNGYDKTYLLSTDGSGLRTLIAAGDTTSATIIAKIAEKYQRNKPVSSTVVEDNIHVIWYLSKYMHNGWHIDGLLTDKADLKTACDAAHDEGFEDITFDNNSKQISYDELLAYMPVVHNLKPIDKTLGVDINQQEHNKWGEIKTSVHIKEAKDVTVIIPIGKQYTLENADTTEVVKYFEELYEVQDYEKAFGAKVNVKVERLGAGVSISITGVTDELLNALARRYNDGLTVEIHTFYKLTDENGNGDFKSTVWELMKGSKVVYDGEVNGLVTSAFNPEEKVEIEKQK